MIRVEDIIRQHTTLPMPHIVLRVLERLLHERDINRLLHGGEGLAPHDFLRYIFRELDVRARVECVEPLDSSGRYLFVANHPFGALDGMLLADMLLERWRDVGVVVNDMLMHIEPLRELWIPVSKRGRQSMAEGERYHEAFASSRQILTFPAGVCSRVVNGRVADLRWHARFVRDAERYDRRIVPVYVDGALSKRFYDIYRLRCAVGFSLNVERLLLVDELFAQSGQKIRIVVGQPIDVKSLRGNVVERCCQVRECVYSLKEPNVSNKVISALRSPSKCSFTSSKLRFFGLRKP